MTKLRSAAHKSKGTRSSLTHGTQHSATHSQKKVGREPGRVRQEHDKLEQRKREREKLGPLEVPEPSVLPKAHRKADGQARFAQDNQARIEHGHAQELNATQHGQKPRANLERESFEKSKPWFFCALKLVKIACKSLIPTLVGVALKWLFPALGLWPVALGVVGGLAFATWPRLVPLAAKVKAFVLAHPIESVAAGAALAAGAAACIATGGIALPASASLGAAALGGAGIAAAARFGGNAIIGACIALLLVSIILAFIFFV